MSDNQHDGTNLMMAILAGTSGPNASEAWVRQKLQNDVTWLASELARLKAEVERLTKAGDVMAESLNGDYNYLLPCVERWNAAKNGGQP